MQAKFYDMIDSKQKVKTIDEYAKLSELLEEDKTWPRQYMFKFIVPFSPDSIRETEALFKEDAKITMRESKTLKYMSITAKQMVDSAQEVIAVYRNAESIKGIMGI